MRVGANGGCTTCYILAKGGVAFMAATPNQPRAITTRVPAEKAMVFMGLNPSKSGFVRPSHSWRGDVRFVLGGERPPPPCSARLRLASQALSPGGERCVGHSQRAGPR